MAVVTIGKLNSILTAEINSMNTQHERSFTVFRRDERTGVTHRLGVVRAANLTLANTKAQRLYRSTRLWAEQQKEI
jgi:hypothetical protein